jgi:predicted amidophosphoribosyltransferase
MMPELSLSPLSRHQVCCKCKRTAPFILEVHANVGETIYYCNPCGAELVQGLVDSAIEHGQPPPQHRPVILDMVDGTISL